MKQDTESGQETSIVVFSGPTATILNTPPLITGTFIREREGLEPVGGYPYIDPLRAQRLARPVTVYIEAFSARPLEGDVEDSYAPLMGS